MGNEKQIVKCIIDKLIKKYNCEKDLMKLIEIEEFRKFILKQPWKMFGSLFFIDKEKELEKIKQTETLKLCVDFFKELKKNDVFDFDFVYTHYRLAIKIMHENEELKNKEKCLK